MTISTKKKMLQVQISADFFDALKEISELENKSLSRVVREMLEALEPGVIQALEMMRAARTMTDEARKKLIPELERHGNQIESNVRYGLENMEKVLKS